MFLLISWVNSLRSDWRMKSVSWVLIRWELLGCYYRWEAIVLVVVVVLVGLVV